MSERACTRPTRAALAVGALIGAVALAGCGAGQITQTATQVSAVEGGSGQSGPIMVRNATITYAPTETAAIYPVGGTAPLEMTIVNSGPQADRLVAASSPIAASVQITGDAQVPGGRELDIESALPAVPATPAVPRLPATAPEGAAGTEAPDATAIPGAEAPDAEAPATAAPDGEAPAGEAPRTVAPSTAAPGARVSAGAAPEAATQDGEQPAAQAAPPAAEPSRFGVANLVLTGLTEDLEAGHTYPLVLTFEKAGEVHVDVPIGSPNTPREDEHS